MDAQVADQGSLIGDAFWPSTSTTKQRIAWPGWSIAAACLVLLAALAYHWPMRMTEPLTTPDGRYIVVRGRLWRRSNPTLDPATRQMLVDELMAARRAVHTAQQADDATGLRRARERVQTAKVGLGERGPVWWDDGTPDLTRRMARNTSYAEWYAGVEADP